MILNIIIIYSVVLILYYINRVYLIAKADNWWKYKVKKYLEKKYTIKIIPENYNNISKDLYLEAFTYFKAFPKVREILLNNKVKDLRSAFKDKDLFDKVVNLKV